MKKTNFFKLFLVGAIALTLGLSSCQDTVSQKDFEAACAKITSLENSVKTITDQLNALGSAVKDVVQDPTDPNKLTVTYTNGNTATIITIKHPEGNGDGDQGSSFITIGDNGNWWIDGKDTEFAANELTPRINTDDADGQYFWEFPVLNEDNEVVWEPGEDAIAAAYAVNNNGVWTLWLPTADNMGELTPIVLPSEGVGAGGLGKIDILGWVTAYKKGDDLTKRGHHELSDTPADDGETDETRPDGMVELHNSGADYDIFWVNYAWINKFLKDGDGYPTGAPETSYLPGTIADRTPNSWNADKKHGKETVELGMVLNTLKGQRQGFIIQVSPANYDISSLKFELRPTQSGNKALPIGFGDPELVTGMLTRATSPNALYFLPGTITGEKFALPQLPEPTGDNVKNTTNRDYEARFYPNAVYALNVIDGGGSPVSSEYTNFTIEPNAVESEEAPVQWIINTDKDAVEDGTDVLWQDDTVEEEEHVYGGSYINADKYGIQDVDEGIAYVVELWDEDEGEGWYKPYFDPTDDLDHIFGEVGDGDGDNHIPVHPGGVTNNVVDYYLELVDTHNLYDDSDNINWDITYITAQFGLEFNDTRTAFRVTRLPDRLTLAWFDLNVFKLGIDGTVYKETVRIHPIRSGLVTRIPAQYYTKKANGSWEYAAGIYPIFDINYDVEGGAHMAEYDNTDTDGTRLGGAMIVDLTPMFDDLEEIPDGVAGADMAKRWQEAPIRGGVVSYAIRKLEIFDPETSETEPVVSLEGPVEGTTGLTDTPLGLVLTNDDTTEPGGGGVAGRNALGQTVITGHKNINPVLATATAQSTTIEPAMNNVRSITLQPQWSIDGVDYMFDVNDRYELTVDFYDRNHNYVNTIIIYFTPVIPDTGLVVKDPRFWNSGARGKGVWNDGKTDVLNAFYKVPLAWDEGMAPNGTRYDIALNHYSSDFSDDTTGDLGGNGGFLEFNVFPYSGPAWATLKYTPKYGATVGDNLAAWNAYDAVLPDVAWGATPAIVYPTEPGTGRAFGVDWANPSPYDTGWPGNLTAAPAIGTETPEDMILSLQDQYVVDVDDLDKDGLATDLVPADLYYNGVEEGNFYGVVFHMDLDENNKYLDVYDYDFSKYEFNMRMLSELYEGWIDVNTEVFSDGVIKVPAATAGNPTPLPDVFVGHTYNGTVGETSGQTTYSIFKEWLNGGAKYRYHYIDRVEFESLPGDGNIWWVVTSADNQTRTNVASEPTADETSKLFIQSGSPVVTVETWMLVKVYDRFGKVLKTYLPIDVVVEGKPATTPRPDMPTL